MKRGSIAWLVRALAGAALAASAVTQADAAPVPDERPIHEALGLPESIVLQVSLRTRFEAIGGQFRPTAPHDDRLFSLRSDVLLEYHTGRLRLIGELRDARGYGEKRGSSAGVSEINAFEPLQALVGYDLAGLGGKSGGGVLAAGRYTLETGAGRLIGRPDFANSINSYTGVLLDWHSPAKDRLVLFANEPSLRLPNDPEDLRANHRWLDRVTSGLRFFGGDVTKAALLPRLLGEAYLYGLSEHDTSDQPTRDRHVLTYGFRLQRPASPGKMDWELEVAHQSGHAHATTAASDTRALPVSAQLVHGEIGRKVAGGWSPRLSLHADLATGDDADPNRYTRFDTLFGAARTDFGPTGLYGPVNRANLRSLGLRVEAAPSKRVDAFAMTRALWLDARTDSFASTAVRDRAGNSGRYAGTQVEGRLRYWLVPRRLKTDIGGAYLAKGRFLRNAPNASAAGDTRYVFIDLAADI